MTKMIRTLTPAEAALPQAKFCDSAEIQPAPDVLTAFETPLAQDKAILPQKDINVAFEIGRNDETGCCLIPYDGHKDGGYIRFKTFFPGVDNHAIQWWYCWRALASVNYMAGNGAHNHSIGLSDRDRIKLQNPGIPLEIKLRGTIQAEVRDTGNGNLEDFTVHFVRPEDMEIDFRHFADPKLAAVCGWWLREDRKNFDWKMKAIDMFLHVCREKDGGVEVTTHVWVGYRCLKGKNRRRDNFGPVIDPEYVKTLARVCAQEQAQLAGVLPDLYAQVGDTL